MKKLFALLMLFLALPSLTAFASSDMCTSKSFTIRNWKGEVETPADDETILLGEEIIPPDNAGEAVDDDQSVSPGDASETVDDETELPGDETIAVDEHSGEDAAPAPTDGVETEEQGGEEEALAEPAESEDGPEQVEPIETAQEQSEPSS